MTDQKRCDVVLLRAVHKAVQERGAELAQWAQEVSIYHAASTVDAEFLVKRLGEKLGSLWMGCVVGRQGGQGEGAPIPGLEGAGRRRELVSQGGWVHAIYPVGMRWQEGMLNLVTGEGRWARVMGRGAGGYCPRQQLQGTVAG